MKVAELFAKGAPVISFEFVPPKTERGHESLLAAIAELKRLDPAFVSVTWGAGGSTRRRTVELTIQIQQELGVTSMAHMTCVGSTRAQIAETLDRLQDAGVQNVLPLGGDRPDDYERPEGGFDYANELVEFVRSEKRWAFDMPGACYPETHPSAPSPETDLVNLARKVEAGVDWLITQLFFDNADYFAFVDRARGAGIELPIVPGIMPVVSTANIRRITALCGARIPDALGAQLDACGDDDARTLEVGIRWATDQCRELLDRGVLGIHFYTLNRSPATRRIYTELF
jgi:methylenetetrahydrofolate reductase (NADPH)